MSSPEDWLKHFLVAQDRPLVPLLVKNDAVGDASPYPRQSLVFCSCPVPGGAQGQPDTALALHMKVISYQKPPAPECFTSAIIALLNIRRKHKPVPMYGSKILLDLFVCHRFLFSLSCSSSDLVLWFWRRGLINPGVLHLSSLQDHSWTSLMTSSRTFWVMCLQFIPSTCRFFSFTFLPGFHSAKIYATEKYCCFQALYSAINTLIYKYNANYNEFFSLNQGMSSHCIFSPFPFLSPLSPQKRGEKTSPLVMDISWKNLFYPLWGKATMQLTQITLRTRK